MANEELTAETYLKIIVNNIDSIYSFTEKPFPLNQHKIDFYSDL